MATQEALRVVTLVTGSFESNAHLVYIPGRPDAVLIDAGDGAAEILENLARLRLSLGAILLTHGHFDHILAADYLRKETGAKIYVHAADAPALSDEGLNLFRPGISAGTLEPFQADVLISEGPLSLCGLNFTVLHTPGHTPGGVCYYLPENACLFSGDTLFSQGYGRTDFPGGSVRDLVKSLKTLVALPEDTLVYPGHGPTASIREIRRYYH